MTVAFRPCDAAIGAEVSGVDLSRPLDPRTLAAIIEAWNDRSVLVFRDQRLDERQLVSFSRRLGELEVHVLDQYLHPAAPEVLIVSNIVEQGRHIGIYDAGRYWHSDLSYMAEPSRGSILYAIEIPEQDGTALGDTLWTSTAAAYEALPGALQRRIDSLQAVFSLGHRHQRLQRDGDAAAVLRADQQARVPEVVHPVVRTHPVNGRRSIFVNEGHTSRMLGLPPDEGQALLDLLCRHCTAPQFQYRHRWRVGDVVLWDNVPTQHLAIHDYALPQRRRLHRTTLRGSRPLPALAVVANASK